MKRRQVLSALGTSTLAAVAGCFDSPTIADISIRNRTDERRAVSIAVSRSETSDSLLNERMELSPDERVVYEEVVGDVGVTIRVGVDETDEQSMEWNDPYDAAGVRIAIERDGIELREVVA